MTIAIAIASLIISLLVAIGVVYREFIHDWRYRPKLEVIFSLEEPISREREFFLHLPEGGERRFCQRLRVKNNGKGVARECDGVLVEVRNPRGELITRYEPLSFTWAISSYERGLKPIDIAPGQFVDLNTLITIEGFQHAVFPTELMGDPHFHSMKDPFRSPAEYLEPGDYWLRVVIYGKNFQPIERGYAVHWDGKNYKEVDIRPMNERPSTTSEWPWSKTTT